MSPSFAMWSVVTPFAVMTLGAGPQTPPSDTGPGTALELALAERACSAPAYAMDPDAHEQCISAQIAALRADFGRDLRRLSVNERKAFDAACGRLNTAVTREGYVDCLNGQIVARRKRLEKSSALAQVEESPVPAVLPSVDETRSSGSPAWRAVLTAGAVLVLAATAGVAFAVRKRRPVRRICEGCKQPIAEAAGLCADCRRAAAAALRHANEERAAEQSAQEALRHEQAQREEEHRLLTAQREAEARLREAEEARRSDEEEQLKREAARPAHDAALAQPVETAFDPYAVLGVTSGADLSSIRAAYEAAKSRYELDSVAHLGYDVQEHYRLKSEAVVRAYEMIAGANP